jgi:hypothetical protein
MTLQELNELTGKILKERPELAEAMLHCCEFAGEFMLVDCISVSNDLQMFFNAGETILLTTEEILWQAN